MQGTATILLSCPPPPSASMWALFWKKGSMGSQRSGPWSEVLPRTVSPVVPPEEVFPLSEVPRNRTVHSATGSAYMMAMWRWPLAVSSEALRSCVSPWVGRGACRLLGRQGVLQARLSVPCLCVLHGRRGMLEDLWRFKRLPISSGFSQTPTHMIIM